MFAFNKITQHAYFKPFLILSFFIFSALIWLGMAIYQHFYVSTDDAYVNANVVQIAPRITGRVEQLLVKNNQFVKQGQLLLMLDAKPAQTALSAALAKLAIAEAHLISAQSADKRIRTLVQRHFSSPQAGEDAEATLKSAIAMVDSAKAELAQAQLNLAYTRIYAPASGWLNNVSLHSGSMVSANQPLFVLVANDEFWIDANFKETEMAGIQPGQLATIVTDLYPKHSFKGIVDSISTSTGSAFSLLPPQNATGNWVKVTQRIPVRIRVLNPDIHHPLRVGISANAKIHLKQSLVTT